MRDTKANSAEGFAPKVPHLSCNIRAFACNSKQALNCAITHTAYLLESGMVVGVLEPVVAWLASTEIVYTPLFPKLKKALL